MWDGAEPLPLVSSEGLCLLGAVPHSQAQSALVLVLLGSRASLADTWWGRRVGSALCLLL